MNLVAQKIIKMFSVSLLIAILSCSCLFPAANNMHNESEFDQEDFASLLSECITEVKLFSDEEIENARDECYKEDAQRDAFRTIDNNTGIPKLCCKKISNVRKDQFWSCVLNLYQAPEVVYNGKESLLKVNPDGIMKNSMMRIALTLLIEDFLLDYGALSQYNRLSYEESTLFEKEDFSCDEIIEWTTQCSQMLATEIVGPWFKRIKKYAQAIVQELGISDETFKAAQTLEKITIYLLLAQAYCQFVKAIGKKMPNLNITSTMGKVGAKATSIVGNTCGGTILGGSLFLSSLASGISTFATVGGICGSGMLAGGSTLAAGTGGMALPLVAGFVISTLIFSKTGEISKKILDKDKDKFNKFYQMYSMVLANHLAMFSVYRAIVELDNLYRELVQAKSEREKKAQALELAWLALENRIQSQRREIEEQVNLLRVMKLEYDMQKDKLESELKEIEMTVEMEQLKLSKEQAEKERLRLARENEQAQEDRLLLKKKNEYAQEEIAGLKKENEETKEEIVEVRRELKQTNVQGQQALRASERRFRRLEQENEDMKFILKAMISNNPKLLPSSISDQISTQSLFIQQARRQSICYTGPKEYEEEDGYQEDDQE